MMSSQKFAKFLLWLNAPCGLGFGVGYAIARTGSPLSWARPSPAPTAIA